MYVKVIDDMKPEDIAMLQSLNSRSKAGVEENLSTVLETGSSNFMDKYYIGFGHDSIGDNGSTTVFIEGISMIAAKIIQHNPLYCGTESSTRYLDFSKRNYYIPNHLNYHEKKKYTSIIESCFDLYDEVVFHLKKRFEDFDVSENTKNAKIFDIARCFLPCATKTNLSWHSNLRQFKDHLSRIYSIPLVETEHICKTVWDSLQCKYSHSFPVEITSNRIRNYDCVYHQNPINEFVVKSNTFDFDSLCEDHVKYPGLFYDRNKYENVQLLEMYGTIKIQFPIDFGCMRDILRHRNMSYTIPIVKGKDIHPWYRDQITTHISKKLWLEYRKIFDQIKDYTMNDTIKQYLYPMGVVVPCSLTMPLNEAIYIAELRSNTTVHPILRQIAIELGDTIVERFGIEVFYDKSEDKEFNEKRGKQTIERKENE